MTWPSGFRARGAGLADVEAITALLVEIEQHDLGEVLVDLDDVAASMRAPGFDSEQDMRLLYARNQLVGYGDVHAERAYARVAPGVRGRGLGTALLAWCEARALEQAGAGTARLGQTVNERATDAIALLHGRGYLPTYKSWVLRLASAEARALQDVAPPPGISLRSMRIGEERTVFEIIERAFSEWPGRSPSTFEAWHSHWLARSDFDPGLLLLAEDAGGELVGALYAIYGDAYWYTRCDLLDSNGAVIGSTEINCPQGEV